MQWGLLSRISKDDNKTARAQKGLDTDIDKATAMRVLGAIDKWVKGGQKGPQPFADEYEIHMVGGNHKLTALMEALKQCPNCDALKVQDVKIFWGISKVVQLRVS